MRAAELEALRLEDIDLVVPLREILISEAHEQGEERLLRMSRAGHEEIKISSEGPAAWAKRRKLQ